MQELMAEVVDQAAEWKITMIEEVGESKADQVDFLNQTVYDCIADGESLLLAAAGLLLAELKED
jgi:hypothetical protein